MCYMLLHAHEPTYFFVKREFSFIQDTLKFSHISKFMTNEQNTLRLYMACREIRKLQLYKTKMATTLIEIKQDLVSFEKFLTTSAEELKRLENNLLKLSKEIKGLQKNNRQKLVTHFIRKYRHFNTITHSRYPKDFVNFSNLIEIFTQINTKYLQVSKDLGHLLKYFEKIEQRFVAHHQIEQEHKTTLANISYLATLVVEAQKAFQEIEQKHHGITSFPQRYRFKTTVSVNVDLYKKITRTKNSSYKDATINQTLLDSLLQRSDKDAVMKSSSIPTKKGMECQQQIINSLQPKELAFQKEKIITHSLPSNLNQQELTFIVDTSFRFLNAFCTAVGSYSRSKLNFAKDGLSASFVMTIFRHNYGSLKSAGTAYKIRWQKLEKWWFIVSFSSSSWIS